MRHLYSVKGCSHCDNRDGCDIKDHKANLVQNLRHVDGWETFCADFMRVSGRRSIVPKVARPPPSQEASVSQKSKIRDMLLKTILEKRR